MAASRNESGLSAFLKNVETLPKQTYSFFPIASQTTAYVPMWLYALCPIFLSSFSWKETLSRYVYGLSWDSVSCSGQPNLWGRKYIVQLHFCTSEVRRSSLPGSRCHFEKILLALYYSHLDGPNCVSVNSTLMECWLSFSTVSVLSCLDRTQTAYMRLSGVSFVFMPYFLILIIFLTMSYEAWPNLFCHVFTMAASFSWESTPLVTLTVLFAIIFRGRIRTTYRPSNNHCSFLPKNSLLFFRSNKLRWFLEMLVVIPLSSNILQERRLT